LLPVAVALPCALGFFVSPRHAWIAGVTVALFVCTAGVIPIGEAALAHPVSRGATLDVGLPGTRLGFARLHRRRQRRPVAGGRRARGATA
jgi:hypothetical protein